LIRSELCDHGQHVEQQPPDRVGRVVHRPAEAELDLTGGELGDDVASIRERAGQPVELGHHQDIAAAARGHRLAQPGPGPIGSGQPVVDIDPLGRDTKRGQRVALRGQVLFVGGDPGVADQQSAHAAQCPG